MGQWDNETIWKWDNENLSHWKWDNETMATTLMRHSHPFLSPNHPWCDGGTSSLEDFNCAVYLSRSRPRQLPWQWKVIIFHQKLWVSPAAWWVCQMSSPEGKIIFTLPELNDWMFINADGKSASGSWYLFILWLAMVNDVNNDRYVKNSKIEMYHDLLLPW